MTASSSTPARRPPPSASAGGSPSGRPTGSRPRPSSCRPTRPPTPRRSRPPSMPSPRSARGSPAPPTRPTAPSARSRSRSTASRRSGDPSRSSSARSGPPSVRSSRGRPGRGSPGPASPPRSPPPPAPALPPCPPSSSRRADDARFLAPFPASALTRDPEVRGRLARFGLGTIGAVAALPRSALVARFGIDEGARLHDRANGVETDPFRSRRAPERLALALALDEPVADLEALRFVLRRLATALGAQLDARGRGGRPGPPRRHPRPDVRPRPPPAPRRRPPDARRSPSASRSRPPTRRRSSGCSSSDSSGSRRRLPVARLELELLDVVPAAGQQLALFTPQANAASRLGWQLARLAVRFGEGSVGRVALGDPEAPLPETRWTWHPVAADGTAAPERRRDPESGPRARPPSRAAHPRPRAARGAAP